MGTRTAVAVSAVAVFAASTAAAVGWPAAGRPAPNPWIGPADQTAPVQTAPLQPTGPVRLVSYDGCTQLLSALKARAVQEVGPWGLPGGYATGGVAFGSAAGVAGPAEATPAAGVASSAGAGTSSAGAAAAPAAAGPTASPAGTFSSTNDQVAGVDEPDIVKTDGKIMAVLGSNPVSLQVVDVAGPAPRLGGSLPLAQVGYPTGMFLTGGDAVVLSQGAPAGTGAPGMGNGGVDSRSGPTASQPSTVVTVVSLADPAHPAVVRSFDLTGVQSAARLIAGRVVVVLQSSPALPFTGPSDGSEQSQAAATDHNRSVIESSTISDWLPTVTAHPAGRTTTTGCTQAWLSQQAGADLGTLSVVSIDPANDQPGPSASIVGDATTVYASTDALYVASTVANPPGGPQPAVPLPAASEVMIPAPDGTSTDISELDLSDPAHIRFVGSGSVPGQLIGQYALDEYQGDLRVATTTGQATPPPGEGSAPVQPSDSRITVLAPQAGSLAPVGAVTGLGTGEKIYAVRFEGPLAYVVTFRQTDPLYVVDLSDPVHPVQRGQLELTGFSSFLQPLGGSQILGVGQSVDANLRQSGLQLSVFDVSKAQTPALQSRVDLPGAFSDAQNDPHALLWWPVRRLIAMPLDDSDFYGVAVWRVDAAGALHPAAQLTQPRVAPPAGEGPMPAGGTASSGPAGMAYAMPGYAVPGGGEREVVVGDLLYTVSQSGIMANDMTSWNQVAWLPFS